MTAVARAGRESRLVSALFLVAVFCATFEKVHWDVAGSIYLADVTTLAFLAVWTLDRLGRPRSALPRTAAVLLGFFVAFLLVYLVGFYNLDTSQALSQFGKGIVKWLIHFAFLIVAVAYLARTLAALLLADADGVLRGDDVERRVRDRPARRGAGRAQPRRALRHPAHARREPDQHLRRGRGSNVYRPNAMTGDPNHLAIMLLLPLLVISPIYLRLERRHPLRLKLALLIAFLLLVELATLSRSGLLGLAVGAFVLARPVPAAGPDVGRRAAARSSSRCRSLVEATTGSTSSRR